MVNKKENLDDLNLPDPNILSVSYMLADGAAVEDKDLKTYAQNAAAQSKKPIAICAKTLYNKNTKLSTYYILCAGGQMFDPSQIDARYKARNNWKFRRVNKTTFNTYCQFLKTKHTIYLRQAERSI